MNSRKWKGNIFNDTLKTFYLLLLLYGTGHGIKDYNKGLLRLRKENYCHHFMGYFISLTVCDLL